MIRPSGEWSSVVRKLGWSVGRCPTMVQRGYYARTLVLVEHFFPWIGLRFAKYLRTVISTRPSHRSSLFLFEMLSLVTSNLYARFRPGEEPHLNPGIGLALGGGFARGYAHLGVLRVFEEHQIPISCISGSSIGSILGAAYASGTPLEQIIKKGREVRFRDF